MAPGVIKKMSWINNVLILFRVITKKNLTLNVRKEKIMSDRPDVV